MDSQTPQIDASGFPVVPPPEEGGNTEASTAPSDGSAPPPQEGSSPPPPQEESPPPPTTPASSPPASPPPSSPPPSSSTPVSSPPPPRKSSPTSPVASNSPPPSTPSSSPSPPPPSGENSPPPLSPPPPTERSSIPTPAGNSTPVTPSPPVVFAPPPPQSVPGAPGRQLPPPSEPRRTPSEDSPAIPEGRSSQPPPSDSSSSSSSSNNTEVVAGVVIAGVILIALIAIWLICSKKKKKQPYYMDPGRNPKGSDPYYNGMNNWNSPNPMDHIVKFPPPQGVMGTPLTPGTAWGATPPPANGTSEFSSGYSGQNQMSLNMGMGGFNQSQFRYEELATATCGFSQANLLGQGGFGYVHKGVLSDGRTVAVKSLKTGSGQGEREFQAEVDIISRVHHRHLVSLVGYCIADGQRMLVYEFVPNKTLEFHLHGKGQPVMEWEFRVRIALGSAKGLAYLHEDCHPKIIHRDIKAANILLDDKYEAMVADFGLAKLSSDNYTHVSTRVMGTFGYMAPEYASSGKLTEKSDVFSFGVMLLELITGRRPVDPNDRYMEDSLVDWARPILAKALEDGDYSEIADPRLEGNYEPQEMARMVACASASIRHSARRRPKMSQIARALEGDSSLEVLNDPVKQPRNSAFNSSSGDTQTYDTGMYNADMSKFRQMVMDNPDNSSEFGTTSDYGLNPSSSSSDSRESGASDQLKHKI